jgi:cation:H+ antiporter
MDYLLLIVGLGLLLLAANYLVDSSVAIAQRAKISNFIIGLTIVGIGTSAPELFVSVSSALSNSGDIAMGNVIGSNIANILLILGVTAIIYPFPIERLQSRRDIPFLILATIITILFANDSMMPGLIHNRLIRVDGIMLLLFFACYMAWVVIQKGKDPKKALAEADDETKSSLTGKAPWLLWSIAIVSLVALIFGGNLFLDSAKNLARA